MIDMFCVPHRVIACQACKEKAMTTSAEKLIEQGHQCDVGEPGYYWARLITWEESAKARAQRKMITHERAERYPKLSGACIVQLQYSHDGSPIILVGLGRRERPQDWLFLERVPDHPLYINPLIGPDPDILPQTAVFKQGPKAP